MNLDIGRSVTYPFEDRGWPSKLIVFLILGFVPGLNLIMWSGYALSVARNMARGEPYPLPGWESWSDIAVRGLLSLAATALYFSPALLITGCLAITAAILGPRAANSVYTGLSCIGVGLALLYGLTANYVLYSGHVQFAATDQFFRYLDIGARLRDLRQMPTLFGMLFAYQTLLGFLIAMLSFVALALFLFALSVIATVGGLAGILMLLVLVVALLGYIAIVTVAFLANGYILGSALLSLPVHR